MHGGKSAPRIATAMAAMASENIVLAHKRVGDLNAEKLIAKYTTAAITAASESCRCFTVSSLVGALTIVTNLRAVPKSSR